MDELSEILGDDLLDDALECCLGDDAAPVQAEADEQNRKVLARRKLARLQRVNPELGKISFGRVLKAGLTGGVSELARTRVGRAIATGGVSEIARAAKRAGKGKAKGKARASVKASGSAKADISGALRAAAGLGARVQAPVMPEIKIRCIPCQGDEATAAGVAKKIGPEMARIHKLLANMALKSKATSEHKKRKRQRAWRKEVVSLLKQVREKRCHA